MEGRRKWTQWEEKEKKKTEEKKVDKDPGYVISHTTCVLARRQLHTRWQTTPDGSKIPNIYEIVVQFERKKRRQWKWKSEKEMVKDREKEMEKKRENHHYLKIIT